MYKTSATSGERVLILEKLRQGMTAPAIACELGFTVAAVCIIRNEALEKGELKLNGEEEENIWAIPQEKPSADTV